MEPQNLTIKEERIPNIPNSGFLPEMSDCTIAGLVI